MSSRAEARSWPNGFSTMSRVQPASPERRSPICSTTVSIALGGTGEVVERLPLVPRCSSSSLSALRRRPRRVVVGEIGRDVADAAGERLPDVRGERVARELAHRLPSRRRSPRRLLACATPTIAKRSGSRSAVRERVERGEELPPGQVAGGAEDDDRAWLGRRRSRGLQRAVAHCSPLPGGRS